MKLVNKLISQIRVQTENENEAAIEDSEILQYLNDAQERLHAVVSAKYPKVFLETKEYNIVTGQSDYELPVNVFLDNKVLNVEYSYTGDTEDYYPLDPITLKERTNYSGYPVNYIRRSGKVTLDPIPDSPSGKIRVEYVKRIRHLDKRRGVIDLITTDSSTITSLVLDTSNSLAIDTDAFEDVEYVCLVDKYGNVGYANIPVDSIDSSTGSVTITSGYSFGTGESASPGDYIVIGENTSTHSEFPRNCERYLIAYASWKLLKRDSSADYAEQQQELLAMEDDIVNSFADVDDDFVKIPVYSSFDYWD